MADTAEIHGEGAYDPREGEPGLDEVIAAFDIDDSTVCMSYSRYFERPNSGRMKAINRASAELFDSFAEILRKLTHDTSGVTDTESRPAILATLIHRMNSNHSELIAEYSDAIILPTNEESMIALETIMSHLGDHHETSELIDAALEHFRETLDTDMELIEQFALEHADSPREKLKNRALQGSFEAAKIGAGVLVGLFAYDRIRHKL